VASTISDEEYCLFHRFWAFEYAKRNDEFQHAIGNIFRTDDADEKKIHKAKLASWGFVGWIHYYHMNWRSKLNVLGVIDDNEQLPMPNNPMWSTLGIEQIEYNGERDVHYTFSGHHRLNKYEALVKIDYSLPFGLLVEALKREHDYYHGSSELVQFINVGILSNSDRIKLERMNVSSVEGVSFEVDHTPRAVGLWVWDFVESRWGVHPPSRQTGFLSEAMKIVRSISPTANARYGASMHQTFSKLYNRTRACIEAVKVLTFK